jgi:hypothetical protein
MARMGEVDFEEAYIPREKGVDIYGYWLPEGKIIINPIPHTVDTILHELVHEHHQDFSDHAVRSVVGRLMGQMSEDELQGVYEEFIKRLRRSRRLQAAEDGRFE